MNEQLKAATIHDQQTGRTWQDVEDQAMEDPVLYRLVRHAAAYGREAALIQAVLFLASERRAVVAQEVDRISRSPAAPILVCCPDCMAKR